MNNYKLYLKQFSLLIVISTLLVSCGGAKGGSNTVKPEANPNGKLWKDFVWDTHRWG